ncbi:DNA ligase D [Cupriavidus sp. CV2]|uniref:DNA ligase D n=1 Tax=Cupriavidus ulmosensis TaxID=3065913 RepID=UPI00296ABBA1|nr:DNA ligase D [Cupriavidus sp. CV2]MDW3683003.1 DNA ligase D [Cupriavidus sp. CV2]
MVARSDKSRPPLAHYQEKRDFRVTPEPAPQLSGLSTPDKCLAFVIQKHWAGRLHYDFRLELDGVLLSWAVPKGPSYDPQEKRMAIHVEDHPIEYANFEGTIPPKQYGAGTVLIWDRGMWEPVGDPRAGMRDGKLVFKLHGEKLAGLWELVRISKPEDKQDLWMLFKKRDEWAQPLAEYDVVKALPDSVIDRPLGLVEQREPKTSSAKLPAVVSTIDLSLAVKGDLPDKLEPQLASLAATLPKGDGWVVEPKFDGYRMMARIDKGRVRLFTRGGHDWTNKLKSLAAEVEKLGITSAWLDGEIVVLKNGLPDFNALQNAIDGARNENVVYFLFDIPYWDGQDLRKVPLSARRARLEQLLEDATGERLRFSQHFDAPPAQVFKAACELGLEGLMFKRHDAPYVSTRTQTWLKAKCTLRQEFVICGFTDRSAAPQEVGSLLLGYHVDGKLRYAGNVGTGWDAKTGRDLWTRLTTLGVPSAPFDAEAVKPGRWSKRTAGSEHWVQPLLVAEVAFAEWTPDGHVRQASFKGLRTDKPASQITREAAKTAASAPAPSSVKVTHPERVIDPSTGLTKLDLVRYYESVADWMLPHLKDRPLSMLRAPNGITEELFFQKHPESKMPGLKEHDPAVWPGHAALLTVDNLDALLSAAQMNVVEFHTWNSMVKRLDKPDRVIFDLDPGEALKWPHMQEAALLVHTLLTELGLKAWLKTSGGKGLHIVVPLSPRLDYDTVKGFSRAFVQHIARTIPQRFSATSGPANRKGKVFVDYLRNGMGQTTVAAFSARARPGLGVSMPVTWEQLRSLKSGAQWTVATAREYLSFQTEDPWNDYWSTRQSLTTAMKRLL